MTNQPLDSFRNIFRVLFNNATAFFDGPRLAEHVFISLVTAALFAYLDKYFKRFLHSILKKIFPEPHENSK